MEGAPRDESNAALAAFGVKVEDDRPQVLTVEVWPEHQKPLTLFLSMLTQWRVGMGGPVGLDYAVLPFVGRRLGFTDEDLDECFADLQGLEREALAWMGERSKG